MPGTLASPTRKAAVNRGLFFVAFALAAHCAHAACNFRPPLANTVPVGAISPALTGNVVASITLRYQCTGGDSPAFAVNGANDTGPGLHRMRNLTMPTAYLPYSAATAVQPTRLIINFTVTEADYRDAWVGAYEDTLIITITP